VLPELASEELQRSVELPGRAGVVHVRFTARSDGDLAITQPAEAVAAARARVVDRPWSWLHQVHGADVVVVERPGRHAGTSADASVTAHPGAVLSVQTADCAPIALVSPEGAVGVVHAGWRGLEAGVVEAAVAALQQLRGRSDGAAGTGAGGDGRAGGARPAPGAGGGRGGAVAGDIRAVLGPCIHPGCYEFGQAELDQLATRFGPSVRGRTAVGTPALDLPAAVRAALRAAGVDRLDQVERCTACDPRFFSHRARGDTGRQALVVWREQP
jgi:copper oxidase (laccase) domain-containing protein